MANELLEAALTYAGLGLKVFPLVPRGKNPAIKGWQDKATTDEQVIRNWWTENPRYNVGIKTGDGLCVIDVDDKPEKHGGLLGSDFLRDWESENKPISETVCCKTPTGGMHYYFDVGDREIPGCQSDEIYIDLRCDGNLIVAPPSVHPETGTAYEWDISPEDMPITKATGNDRRCIDWIHSKASKRKGGTGRTVIPENPVKSGEGRNNFLYLEGCSVRGRGGDDSMVELWITQLNATKCDPPLPKREVEKIVESVCSLPIGQSAEVKEAAANGGSKRRRFEHNKVARRLMDESRFCFVDGMPAVFSGGRWRVGWNAVDAEIIRMHDDCTIHDRREVKAYLGARGGHRAQSPCELVAFENGVLDIRTMELREYREDDVIPNVIPHRWNPDAEFPLLDATLERMARGDGCVLADMQQVIGMCMARTASRLAVCPVLMGGGSNGKSTFIRLLQRTVGAENISAMQPDELPQRFQMLNLLGKTANLGDDIKGGYLDMKECKTIKSVSTGDIVTSDVKGNDTVTFSPYATMVFSCNAFPRLADTTDGMMRRFFPIPFTARFDRSDPDFDPAIGEKLDTEECLERACVMGIEGLRLVLAEGMVPNEQSEAILASIRTDSSTVLQWLEDRGLGGGGLVGWTKAQAYADYSDWCDANGSRNTKMTSATMSAQLRTFERLELTGYADGTGHASGKRVRVYRQMP